MDILRPLVDEKPVVIFSKANTDALSHSMKQLFTSYGANPTVYVTGEMSNGEDVESALENIGHTVTLPVIFIGGCFIGGPNEVISLQVRGELGPKLIKANAIWVWN